MVWIIWDIVGTEFIRGATVRLDRYGDPGHREKLAGLFFSPPWTRSPKGYEPKCLLSERYQERRQEVVANFGRNSRVATGTESCHQNFVH